jgi:DNA-binding transcriptional MerR regulator
MPASVSNIETIRYYERVKMLVPPPRTMLKGGPWAP